MTSVTDAFATWTMDEVMCNSLSSRQSNRRTAKGSECKSYELTVYVNSFTAIIRPKQDDSDDDEKYSTSSPGERSLNDMVFGADTLELGRLDCC